MKFVFKLLAPYLAMGVFWTIFQNAWLSILAYHVQIVAWNYRKFRFEKLTFDRLSIAFLSVSATAGVATYFILPHVVSVELEDWFVQYRLEGVALLVMVPYFGLLHPYLEEKHWEELRDQTWISHFVFAGYHYLVLSTLLKWEWVLAALVVLASVSFAWKWMRDRYESNSVSVLSHSVADLGIVLAAVILI